MNRKLGRWHKGMKGGIQVERTVCLKAVSK